MKECSRPYARFALDLRPGLTSQPDTAATFEARMAERGVPGVGFAVIRHGCVEETGYYGETTRGGRRISADTLFQAASISKIITALVTLRLVEAGRLDLDADIGSVLRSWALPRGGHRQAVTPRRLLNHSAGVTVHGFPGYAAGTLRPTLTEILDGSGWCNTPAVVVDQEPGTAWRYSGGGTTVLQQVLEDVLDRSFADAADDLVLRPLGMLDSTFAQPLSTERAASAALPHDDAGVALPEGAHLYPELAAAGLWSTPSDLARCALAVQRAASGKAGGILSVDMARAMLAPGLGSWGLGPTIGADRSRQAFGHAGSNAGFRCWLWVHVDGPGLVVRMDRPLPSSCTGPASAQAFGRDDSTRLSPARPEAEERVSPASRDRT